MLNSPLSDLNELNEGVLLPNATKIRDYQIKLDDPSNILQTSSNKLPKQISQHHEALRRNHFEYSKTKPPSQLSLFSQKQSDTEIRETSSIIQRDKGLMRLPYEIIQIKNTLTVLDISKNKFEYFPLEIVQLQALQILRMDYNRIKCIPNEIVKLSNLETFSVSYNCIAALPSSLPKLKQLRELNLEYNMIENFSQEITEIASLEALNILQNRLASFPCSFKNLEKLIRFHFEWFRYTDPPINIHLKAKEDEHTIKKLRNKCAELWNKNIKSFGFQDFLDFFSYEKVSLKPKDNRSRTILHTAAINEDISVIRYLISYVPELLDLCDRDGMTALCLSLIKEKFRAASYLLKHGANPTKGGGVLGSPLHIATKKLSLPLVKQILELGENPNKPDPEENTPLHLAIALMADENSEAKQIVEYMLDHGANPNARNKDSWTPLHIAVRKRSNAVLEWVLSYNLEIEEIHGKGEVFKINKKGGMYNWTPMHIATYSEAPDLIMILGDAGVNVFKKSINGYTPKRVINRPGIALKLINKYEKEAVQKMLFSLKKPDHECLGLNQLEELNNPNGIRNASKNRFGESSPSKFFYFDQTKAQSHRPVRTVITATKRADAPILNTEPMMSKKTEDSVEIFPETDVNNSNMSMEGSEKDQLDFCSELNEDILVEVNPYTESSCFPEKNTMINKGRLSYHQRAITINYKSKVLDQDGSLKEHFIIDLDKYEKILKNEPHFGFGYCKDELKCFKEKILSENVVLSEKLRLFTALRILHKVIIEYIYKTYKVSIPLQEFPHYILKESVNKGRNKIENSQDQSKDLSKMISLYEMIPNHLISLFMSLGSHYHENSVIKGKICQMLGDTIHFSAMDFLKNVINNPMEERNVISEAKKAYHYLSDQLVSRLTPKETRRDWSTSRGRQLGDFPNPSKEFIPVRKLDKTL